MRFSVLVMIIFILKLHAAVYPEVFSTVPQDGASAVPVDGLLKVYFSQHMNQETISSSAFSLTDQYGTDIRVSVIYDDDRKCALLKPLTVFDWNTDYTLMIAGYLLKNQTGFPMKTDSRIKFRTVPEISAEEVSDAGKDLLPKLLMTSPVPGARNIALNTEFVLSFNKDMLPSSLNRFTVILYNQDQKVVPGAYRYIKNLRRMYFKPEKLEESGSYQLEIREGIRDLHGNLLQNPQKISVTTMDQTPPLIVYTSPEDKAVEVSSGARLAVRFNEAVDSETLNPENIIFRNSKGQIPLRVEYDERFFSLELKPSRTLLPETYSIQLKGISDLSGNRMSDFSLSFQVIPDRDRTPPELLRHKPEKNEQSIAVNTGMFLWFSEELDEKTVNGLNVFVTDRDTGKPLKCRIGYSKDEKQITINPLEKMPHQSRMIVTVRNISDPSGNTMAETGFQFETAIPPDVTPPEIISRNFSEKVSIDHVFEIKFSEPLKQNLITASTIVLIDADQKAVTGEVILRLPETLIFRLSDSLEYETEYSIRIFRTDISDLTGNQPAEDIEILFETEDRPDKKPPVFVSSVPAVKDEGVAVNIVLSALFSEELMKESVNIYSVLLYRGNETILGSTELRENGREICFRPRTDLSFSTEYTLIVTEQVCDLYKNFLKTPVSISFCTENQPDRIAPRVVYTSPLPGALHVKKNTLLAAGFSEAVNAADLNRENITLNSEEENIPLSIQYNPLIGKLIATPQSELLYSRHYTFKISNAVRDIAGNHMPEDKVISFQVEAAPDHQKPEIVLHFPGSNEENVSTGRPVRIVFSEPLDDRTVNEYTVILQLENSREKVRGIVRYTASECALEFIPENPLEFGKHYKLTLSSDITDVSGNRLDLTELCFSTEKAPDTQRPEIVKVFPENGSSGVLIDSELRVDFSEPVNEITLNEFTVFLAENETDQKIRTNLRYNRLGHYLVIKTAEKLKYSNRYLLTVSRTVEDTAGNCLAGTKIVSFVTESSPDEVPPLIVRTYPQADTVTAEVTCGFTVVFSEKLEDKSVSSGSVILKTGEKDVNCAVSYDEKTKTVNISPAVSLEYSTDYLLCLTSGIRDLAGNRLQNTVLKFKTEMRPDLEKPRVIRTFPDHGDGGIKPECLLKIYFSEAVDQATVNSNTVTLMDGKTYIPGIVGYNSEQYLLEFAPAAPLQYSRVFHLVISDGVRDLAGNALEKNVIVEFSTMLPPDMEPPRLVNYTPAANSTDNSLRQTVKLYFSEQLKEETINVFTVMMKCRDMNLPLSLSYSPLERSVVAVPQADLKEGEQCLVTVTNGITDVAGNGLANPKSFYFYSGSPKDFSSPRVLLTMPEKNSRDVPAATVICAAFSSPVDPATLNRFTFIVREGTRNIDGRIMFNKPLNRAEFYPDKDLAGGRSYQAVITRGVRGINGMPMDESISWNFSVADYKLEQ